MCRCQRVVRRATLVGDVLHRKRRMCQGLGARRVTRASRGMAWVGRRLGFMRRISSPRSARHWRNPAPVVGRLPGRCNSRTASTPSPHATRKPSSAIPNTVPGAASCARASMTLARSSRRDSPAKRVSATGHGLNARICRSRFSALRVPVDLRLRLLDLGRVRRAVTRLRARHDRAGREPIDGLEQRRGAELGQRVVQVAGGVMRCDRPPPFEQDGAGIETFVELHDGDAGFGIAGKQGTLNRRGATPTWQQRTVDVHAAEARQRRAPAAAGSAHRPPRPATRAPTRATRVGPPRCVSVAGCASGRPDSVCK